MTRGAQTAAAWVALAIILGGMLAWILHWRLEHRYDQEILVAARRYGVDPALVKAVVWKESDFDPGARGGAGERGLMQIQEAAAVEWFTAEKVPHFELDCLLDPQTNTLVGTFYLARLLRRYQRTDDPVPYALADYNAGRGNVLKWVKGPAATNAAEFALQVGFPSTRNYIAAVRRRQERYRGDF